MLDVLRKLKGRSIDELRVRGSQALSARTERYGLTTDCRLPSDANLFRLLNPTRFDVDPKSSSDLLKQFRKRTSPKFFAAFDNPSAMREELRRRFSIESRTLIERADRIVEGRFDLLGFKDLCFGEPIDWHFEPVSGKRSPLVHWSRIDEIDSIVTGDKKVVWELNRHQYFATLGRAYWSTQDERYAQTFANHLADWMDKNPPKLGLNWVSSLEVAFRAISWLWGLYFFMDSSHLAHELYTRALKFLYLHARHLDSYLSTYSSPNTHLTGEALGLYYLGSMLPEFRDAPHWRKKGRRILVDELERHVLQDGVYFERASYYHRYTTDFYTHFVILAERNADDIGENVKAKLQALFDHLMYITKPDGNTPLIGDEDGGQLALLDERRLNDFRAALATGAVLFDRGDFKFVAGELAESTLWLLGNERVQSFDLCPSRVPDSESYAFPDGGYYVMRDGWAGDANYLLIDCGPHGVFNGGHAHAGALAFELAAFGRTLLVDTGTYTYTGSRELRDQFRSSAAHNTLTIDGESSSVSSGPFSWKETADSSVIAWKNHTRFDFFQGTHDGYKRLKLGSAAHTRSFLFLKGDYWIMRDSVKAEGSHQYEQHFHFAVGSRPVLEQSNCKVVGPIASDTDLPGLQLVSFAESGKWRIENGWVSTCYGERTNAPVCIFTANGIGAQDFYSFLFPRRAVVGASVCEITATGGHVFEVKDENTHDIILFGNSDVLKTERTTTDFKWAWVRLSNDSGSIKELVLIDGRYLSFDGQDVIRSTERIDYVVARHNGDTLMIEMDEQVKEL
jgi:hypothetical protein